MLRSVKETRIRSEVRRQTSSIQSAIFVSLALTAFLSVDALPLAKDHNQGERRRSVLFSASPRMMAILCVDAQLRTMRIPCMEAPLRLELRRILKARDVGQFGIRCTGTRVIVWRE